MDAKPETELVRAIDVKPNHWSLWCTVGGSEPFANEIVSRKWSDDGEKIVFMLESHNFLFALPEEELELVPTKTVGSADLLSQWDKKDEETMAVRPVKKVPCVTCGHVEASS